jgi:hypothetical protein
LLCVACASGRYRVPSVLAGMGATLAGGGAVAFAAGDREHVSAARAAGAGALVAGLAVLITAGVFSAVRASCQVDADCAEGESCLTQFTTAGSFGFCIPR